VREMVRLAVDEFGDQGDDAFVLARQENLETIHRHSVVAERHGLMGELQRELREEVSVPHHVTRREWLEDRSLLG
jgi:GTP cyclohydrolase-4